MTSIRSPFLCAGLIQGSAQALGELGGIIIAPEVQEEEPRFLGEGMAVQGSDVDAMLLEGLTHPRHFPPQQHKVAGGGRLAPFGCLEVDRGGHPNGGWQHHPMIRDLLSTGETELVDAPIGLALGTKGLIELAGIKANLRWLGTSRWCRQRRLAL